MSPYHHHHTTLRERFARLPLSGKLAVGALASGGVLRLVQAWAGRAVADPEAVAAALAARRIAHGTAFHLLGDAPYRMGPIEPAVGGMLHTALGESGFVAGLASALFAFAALWALWRWGREAAGDRGGLLALLAGVFGVPAAFAVQAVPLGGWMAAIALETLVMAQASRMAYDIRDAWEPSPNAYAGLGLMAGFALWTTRLAVPALLVAWWVLARAMKCRWKKHWKGLLALAAGFLPGLAAWLCGLARTGWDVAAAFRGPRPFASFAAGFLDLGGGTPAGTALVLLLLATAFAGLCTAVAAAWRHRHHHHPARSAAVALAVAYPLWLALTGEAADPTGRPWLPWLPAAAVLAAVACETPKSRWVRRAATAALLAGVAGQALLATAALVRTAGDTARRAAEWDAIADALAGVNATALVAPARDYGLNLRLRETVAVTDGAPSCDPVILRKAEIAESPVWSGDYPGLAAWLRATGAGGRPFEAAGRTFFAGLQAPLPSLREWPAPPRRAADRDGAPSAPAAMLADGHLDSWLEGQDGALTVEWTFPGPESATPAALRLLFDDRGQPERFVPPGIARVEILRGGAWETIGDLPLPSLETSLGRPYPPASLWYRDLPLPPPRHPADALRLTVLDAPGAPGGRLPWRLSEAALFVETGDGPADPATLLGDDVFSALRDHLAALPPETAVFAPRRLAGRLAATAALLPAQLPTVPSAAPPAAGDDAPTSLIPDDRPSCLCIDTRHADAARIALGVADRPAETDVCGPWTLFRLPPADPEKRLPGLRLRWAGDGPVADLDFRAVDRLSDIILGKLEGQKTRRNEWLRAQLETPADAGAVPGTGPAPAMRWREEPVADDPEALPAAVSAQPDPLALDPQEERKLLRFIRQLSLVRPQSLAVLPEEIVYKAGGSDLLALRARSGARPAHPTDTVFHDGLVLQGIDATRTSGTRLSLVLYWQATGTARDRPDATELSLLAPDGTPIADATWTGPANVAGAADFGIPLLECQTELRHLDLPAGLPPDAPLVLRVSRRRDGLPIPVKSTRGTLLPDASAALLPLSFR